MAEPLDPAPEELLRLSLAPSDGSTPAGSLGLVHAIASHLARQTGGVLPAEADQHHPGTHAERSGKIIAAESRAAHAIDQSEVENPVHVAERDQILATGKVAKLAALNAAALDQLHALLAEMAAVGYSVDFELRSAVVGVRAGE